MTGHGHKRPGSVHSNQSIAAWVPHLSLGSVCVCGGGGGVLAL